MVIKADMTDEKKRKLQNRMDALREKYCNQLPDKYYEIENSWKQYQTDFSNPAFIELFYRLVHTLKGTAATFGFVTQADTCFEIQKLLLKIKEDQSILTESSAIQIQEYLAELKANINMPAEDITD